MMPELEFSSEIPTGNSSKEVADWRQLLSVFDELDAPFKDTLTELAHGLLKLQNELKR